MNIRDIKKTQRGPEKQISEEILPQVLYDDRLNKAGILRPKVSFIVTSYNYEPYIIDCLNSVEHQTYDNWECIIVDDVSTDKTVERVRQFIAQSTNKEKFKIICRIQNGGQMEAFREGLKLASGCFVVMLDADDVLLEDFLEVHMTAHLSVKTVAFTSSNQYQINGTGEIIGGQHMDHQSKGHYRHVTKTQFQKGFWIWATSSSMVFRRSTVELIMPNDNTTFRICADYYIAHFCHLIGDSLLIPSVHGCYRRHGKNNFGSNPVLGNINSVGNLDHHPPHDLFRKTMIHHILTNHELFYPIFMGKGLVLLLLRLVKIKELPDLVSEHTKTFPHTLLHYILIAFRQKWLSSKIPICDKFNILSGPDMSITTEKLKNYVHANRSA